MDPYTGEAAALVKTSKSSYFQLRQDLSQARENLTSQFNLNNETLKNMQNLVDNRDGFTRWLEGVVNWFNQLSGT